MENHPQNHIEAAMNEIYRKSEWINDGLWYVNPEDIRMALTDLWKKAHNK